MSIELIQQSYNEVPYPDLCYTQTHPDRLASLATLLGLKPSSIEDCRVLEIGCAVGGNIIPMANSLPNSEFIGIDISPHQIAIGQQTIRDLGLTNVSLLVTNILDIDPDFGQFDYIIAHGIYSWVPAPVRDKLMSICQHNLSPNGIAYISYNVYPGWHMLGALRDMMLYHIRDLTDPQERAHEARQIIDFLLESSSPDDPYGTLSSAYHELLQSYNTFVTNERKQDLLGDQLALHDELAPVNDAVYFHEFIEHAQRHELQYLIESDLSRVMPQSFPPDVAQQLMQMSKSTIDMEQYMDFMRNRSFRQTLLCHADIPLKRGLNLTPDSFYIATYAIPISEKVNIHDDSTVQFRGPDGAILTTDHPVTKAAMVHLAKIAPTATPFRVLLNEARQQVYGEVAAAQETAQIVQDAQMLAANLLQAYGYSNRLVELHVFQAPFVYEVREKPVGSPLAQRQIRHGNVKVTNLRHERVTLDNMGQFILLLLDGEHTQADIVEKLMVLVESGELTVSGDRETAVSENLAQEVALSVQFLSRAALLVG